MQHELKREVGLQWIKDKIDGIFAGKMVGCDLRPSVNIDSKFSAVI